MKQSHNDIHKTRLGTGQDSGGTTFLAYGSPLFRAITLAILISVL